MNVDHDKTKFFMDRYGNLIPKRKKDKSKEEKNNGKEENK